MTRLPSGTVTLVFTDIERSTRLLHRLGDAYGRALEEHRRLMRAAVTAAGGVEVETRGDSFLFAFGSAHPPPDGAVQAPRAPPPPQGPGGGTVRRRLRGP